jgi:hypothetical protein
MHVPLFVLEVQFHTLGCDFLFGSVQLGFQRLAILQSVCESAGWDS